MSDNDPTGIWQDWRKASDERDEARQLAVDFRYRFEAAQKANKAYMILLALDRDNMAQLERRIAELEQSEAHLNEEIEATSELWAFVDHARLGLSE